jgi:hypothetical protein
MKALITTFFVTVSLTSFARSLPRPVDKHVVPAQLNYQHSLVCDIAKETVTQNVRNKRLYTYRNQAISSANSKKKCYQRFENHLNASCKMAPNKRSRRLSRRVTLRMYKPGGNAKDSFATMTKERVCNKPIQPRPLPFSKK